MFQCGQRLRQMMKGGVGMKRFLVLLMCAIFLGGCGGQKDGMDEALDLRGALLQAESCTFTAHIIADYGESLYRFSMDCTADREGNLTFTVTAPESISGITGKITTDGGKLIFDDTVLYIPMLTDDQITPVSAPWIFLRTLRSGYITACAEGRMRIDDSYADDALSLDITVDANGYPSFAEILWKNRRILSLEVVSFTLS